MDDDRWYILQDKVPVPCEGLEAWALWAAGNLRHIAYDQIGEVAVSTIFLGWNQRVFHRDSLPPILFETMILGGEHHGYQVRTCTWQEAEAAHTEAWDLVAGVHA
jgi:hypothetical protein